MVRVAFITGVSGQDGSYLTELLLGKGYEIHGYARRSSNHQNLTRIAEVVNNSKFHLHVGDMTDSTSIHNVLTDIWASIKNTVEVFELYNLAAQSHVGQSFSMPEFTAKVDALAPLSLLEWMRTQSDEDRSKIRFYQASTSELYGKVMEVPQSEKTPFYPRSPYAVAKLYAYWIVRNYRESYGLYAVNGILFNHESPRRGTNFVTNKVCKEAVKIKLGLSKELKLGNLDATRDWGHAKDYVEAMWLILQQDKSDDFVCSTGISHSVRELCDYVFSSLELDWKEYVTQDEKFLRPEELHDLKGDCTKLKVTTGWTPQYTFETMLDEMINYWLNYYKK